MMGHGPEWPFPAGLAAVVGGGGAAGPGRAVWRAVPADAVPDLRAAGPDARPGTAYRGAARGNPQPDPALARPGIGRLRRPAGDGAAADPARPAPAAGP